MADRWRRTRRDLVNAPFGNVLGPWYRFARYEVCDGCVRPVDRADLLQYDPWYDFRARAHGDGVERAYDPLLRLADAADHDPDAVAPLIVAWCNQHGLLGLLPHRVLEVSLAARWEYPPAPIPRNQVWALWRRHVRSSDRWVEVTAFPDGYREALAHPDRPPAGFPVAPAEQAGRLVPPELCATAWGRAEGCFAFPWRTETRMTSGWRWCDPSRSH